MPLFEVAILETPTKKEVEEGKAERLVFGPKAVIARESQGAAIAAVTSGGMAPDVDMQRINVIVRPFA